MGSIVGAGIGIAGSLLSSRSKNKALKKAAKAAAFNPWNVSGPGGSSTFNPKTRTASFSLDPASQGLMDMFGGAAGAYGQYSRDMLPFTQSMAGLMPGLFSDAQSASQVDPAMIQNLRNVLNPEIARQQGAAGGLFDVAQNYLGGSGPGMDQAGQMFDLGMGMFGRNYQDVAADRTGALRQLAAPYEERAKNDMFSSLFKMGQLGGPGGERMFQSFGQGLGEADLRRVVEGQNLAEGIYGRDLQAGMGLTSTGMEGMFRGAGMGLDAAGMGLGASVNAGNMGNMLYGGEGLFSDLVNQRAGQRMTNAQGMFGFGLDAQSAELQNALASLQGYTGLVNQGRGSLEMGMNLGQAGAAAGANQAQYLAQRQSPLGGILQGVGMGMMGGMGGGGAGGVSSLGSMFSRIGGSVNNSLTNWYQQRKMGSSAGNINPYGPISITPPGSIWGPSGPPKFNFWGG